MTTFGLLVFAVLLVMWLMPTDQDEGVDLGVLVGNVDDSRREE